MAEWNPASVAGGLVGIGGLIVAALGAFYGRKRDKSADWSAFTTAVNLSLEDCRDENRLLRTDLNIQRTNCEARIKALEERLNERWGEPDHGLPGTPS